MTFDDIVNELKNNNCDKNLCLAYVLYGPLSSSFLGQGEVHEDSIYYPHAKLKLTVDIFEANESFVNLGIQVEIDGVDYFIDLSDMSAGLGGNLFDSLNMAINSFIYSYLYNLARLLGVLEDEEELQADDTITSNFAGHEHNFAVYTSNTIRIGCAKSEHNGEYFKAILMPHLTKYLGNQELYHVKVYLSSNNGEIISEVRINNTICHDLTKIVNEVAQTWDDDGFGSVKFCYLFKQDSKTVIDYPYKSEDDFIELVNKICNCMVLFTKDDADMFSDKMFKEILDKCQDQYLAHMIVGILPDICAMIMIDDIEYSDTLSVSLGNSAPQIVYKSSWQDFMVLYKCVETIYESDAFDESTDSLLNYLTSFSSIYSALCAAAEDREVDIDDLDLSGMKLNTLLINMDKSMQLR